MSGFSRTWSSVFSPAASSPQNPPLWAQWPPAYVSRELTGRAFAHFNLQVAMVKPQKFYGAHLCWVVTLMLLSPNVSNAQTGMRLYGGGGAGTAGDHSLWLVAGGAEWLSRRKWGVGAEAGVVHSEATQEVDKSTVNTDVLWVYVTADLAQDDSKLAPYLRAGASFFGDAPYDTSLGVLFGGGVNYWFKRGLGLRVDLRTDLAFGRNGGLAAVLGLVVR